MSATSCTGSTCTPSTLTAKTDVTDGTRTTLGTRVLAFTDREQAVAAVAAITAKTVVNAPVVPGQVKSLTASSETSFTGTYDDDGMEDTPPLTGTFDCTGDPGVCTLEYTGTADDPTVTDSQLSTRSPGAELPFRV